MKKKQANYYLYLSLFYKKICFVIKLSFLISNRHSTNKYLPLTQVIYNKQKKCWIKIRCLLDRNKDKTLLEYTIILLVK